MALNIPGIGKALGGMNVGGIGTGNFSVGGNFNLMDQKQAIASKPASEIKELYQAEPGVKTYMYPDDLDGNRYIMFEIQQRVRTTESVKEVDAQGNEIDVLRSLNQKSNTHTTLVLPIPTQIQDNRGVSYSNEALGVFGGIGAGQAGIGNLADDAIKAVKTLGGTALSTTGKQVGNAVDNGGSTAVAVAGAALTVAALNYANKKFNTGITLGQATGVGGLAAVVAGAKGTAFQAGVAYNPRMSVQFTGVGFRQFTFSYKLIARSENESVQITNIVRTLQKYMAPKYFGSSQTGFIYPDEFFISLATPLQQHMFKFLPCVLTDCNVTYNSEGQAFFEKTNAPVSVDISLTFQETKIITRDEIERLEPAYVPPGYEGFGAEGEFGGGASAQMNENKDYNNVIGATNVNPAEAQAQPSAVPPASAADGAVPPENASSIFGQGPGGA